MVYLIEGHKGSYFATEAVSEAHALTLVDLLCQEDEPATVTPMPDEDLLVIIEQGELAFS